MIQYFPNDKTQREGWWDIAHNGKRVGYIIKSGDFFEVTVHGDRFLMEAWTTMDAVKSRVEEALGDVSEAQDETWADVIE